jgi:hypothetical protein
MSEKIGPSWLYMLAILLLELEYYVWPMEMAAFMFQSDFEKIRMLTYEDNIDKWHKKSRIWGSVFGGLAGLFIVVIYSIPGALTYTLNPWFYVEILISFSFQNWWMFAYCYQIPKSNMYRRADRGLSITQGHPSDH